MHETQRPRLLALFIITGFELRKKHNTHHSPKIKAAFAVFVAIVFVPLNTSLVLATEDYALETGQPCSVCHVSDSGGGGLTTSGEFYIENPEGWQPPLEPRAKTPLFFKILHTIILYAHVLFGILWIGTILYVHLVLKPKYALGGLPKSELRLAWLSMPIILVSGILLTVWRTRITANLFSTMFGKLLLIKMGIFMLMLSSATFVTLYVGPRLKKLVESHAPGEDTVDKSRFTLDELKTYDGTRGNRILIAAQGEVWDVSSSRMWKDGEHAMRHHAGEDLTEHLKDAPHDPDVLERYEKVGELVSSSEKVPVVIRIFTVNAYFNLIGCFLIVLIIVLWRW